MKKIGLLSDTHSYLDPHFFELFATCEEIWHAGDIGDPAVADQLAAFKPFRAVYGNIDDSQIRSRYPLDLHFTLEEVTVYITHIGGYPGHYTPRVRQLLDTVQPKLYICGHSHILKVMPDRQRSLLHLNPGAAGKHGFHHLRTALRFELHEGQIQNMEAIELGLRGEIERR